MAGYVIPVEIYVYEDRTFTFITKTPPASDLLKKQQAFKKVPIMRRKIRLQLSHVLNY